MTTRKTQEITLNELRQRTSVSVNEAAIVLGIGRATAYKMAKDGELPVIGLPTRRCIRISAPALMALITGPI